MSIEGKHAYRFGYLKSDKWKTVRLEALVREKGRCQICSEESISNDAHHIWYPESIWETQERHLVILCRICHDFVHCVLPDCKTKDEEYGTTQWNTLKNAIIAWRRDKQAIFSDPSGMETEGDESKKISKVSELRKAHTKLHLKCKAQQELIRKYETTVVPSLDTTPISVIVSQPSVTDGPNPVRISELRSAYNALKIKCRTLESAVRQYAVKLGVIPTLEPTKQPTEVDLDFVVDRVKKWAKAYESLKDANKTSVDNSSNKP